MLTIEQTKAPTSTSSSGPLHFTLGSSSSIHGSGCPTKESLQVISVPDGKAISILYSEYIVEAGTNNNIDRKTCNIAIPVDVKNGKSVGVFRVDYRGNAYAPSNTNSYGIFSAEYFFAGSRGYKINERFDQGYNDDFMISTNITEADIAWCECGGASTIFRINSSILAYYDGETSFQSVEISIDSADAAVKKGFQYFFAVKDY